MMISKKMPINTIEIWAPKYHGEFALLACYKIRTHNKVIFTKAKHLLGREFYISGDKAKTFEKGTNGTIEVYKVPMKELEPLEYKEDIADIARDLFS